MKVKRRLKRLSKRLKRLERLTYTAHPPAGFIWPDDYEVGLEAKRRARRH